MPATETVTPPSSSLTSQFKSAYGSNYNGINALLKIPTVAPTTTATASSGTTTYTAFAKASASTGESGLGRKWRHIGDRSAGRRQCQRHPGERQGVGRRLGERRHHPQSGGGRGPSACRRPPGSTPRPMSASARANLHATASVSVGVEVGASVDYTKQFSNGGSVNAGGSTTVGRRRHWHRYGRGRQHPPAGRQQTPSARASAARPMRAPWSACPGMAATATAASRRVPAPP